MATSSTTADTVESSPQPKSPPQDWQAIPALKGSGLAALFHNLSEIETEIDDLEIRKGEIRGLIEELVRPLGLKQYVRVDGRLTRWVPAIMGTRTDAKKLILVTGATPDQIAKAQVPANKAGFLEIRQEKGEAPGSGARADTSDPT